MRGRAEQPLQFGTSNKTEQLPTFQPLAQLGQSKSVKVVEGACANFPLPPQPARNHPTLSFLLLFIFFKFYSRPPLCRILSLVNVRSSVSFSSIVFAGLFNLNFFRPIPNVGLTEIKDGENIKRFLGQSDILIWEKHKFGTQIVFYADLRWRWRLNHSYLFIKDNTPGTDLTIT